MSPINYYKDQMDFMVVQTLIEKKGLENDFEEYTSNFIFVHSKREIAEIPMKF